ncbi:hypothetical protein RRG08_054759 [Elysia crispata]|uniref:Reverse transcriptase domain-containing protein n=1 Tax=Elysia crispata TaxID=231223 RepID=A0AAE0YWZ1_9GAST|nr:hypothetical protein RRG08_054759 [Elysia crispata]
MLSSWFLSIVSNAALMSIPEIFMMTSSFSVFAANHLWVQTTSAEDELRIIRFLLSNTKIKTRINGPTKTNTFISNVGTPQGDSLSPVLFIVYLEHALKEVRTTLPRPIVKYKKGIPNEIAYADDVDFIGQNYVNINEIQETLHKYQLKVNTDKTEFTALSKNEEDWKNAKKVGSLIGDLEDVERRKQLSTAALNKLYHQRKTRLIVDVSPVGLGAVLTHVTSSGEFCPIAFASRALSDVEKRYSQTEKGALAVA